MYRECIKMHTVPSRNLFSRKKGKNRGYHEVKTLHKRGKFSNSMHTIKRRTQIYVLTKMLFNFSTQVYWMSLAIAKIIRRPMW